MKSKFIKFVVLAIILISFSLMIWASKEDAATVDEHPHIAAGFSYLHFKDYRLNPEHPPLAKDIAAFPLQFLNLNFPENIKAWQKDINGQWETGRTFLYHSGNDAEKIIFWSRFGIILLTLLTSYFVYKWAKELIGPVWALLPFFLFSLSPLVLAHGHYVTTDIAATFGFLIGLYYFLKFLEKPKGKNIIKAGFALGIALLMKFSVFFLLPVIFFIYLFWQIKKRNFHYFLFTFSGIILIFLISFALIYLVYLHHTWNQKIEKSYFDAKFILSSFAGGEDPKMISCHQWVGLKRQPRCLAEIDLKLFQRKFTLPIAQYLLGLLMVFQRSIGGNTTYFLGEVSSSGWWYYFPVVFFLKEPIPSLILIFLAIIIAFTSYLKRRNLSLFEDKEHNPSLQKWSMIFLIISYWFYTMKGNLNIGLRHILPTLPFIYILTSAEIKKWFYSRKPISANSQIAKAISSFIFETKNLGKYFILFSLIIWYFLETIFVAPCFISYFNEFAGGPENGYKYVVDSNLDWGQDLKRLANFVEKEKIKNIKVDYFGWADPSYYLGSKYQWWTSSKGKPQGYFALSLTFLQGAKGKLVKGEKRRPQDEYRWLKDPYHPYARVGHSIFVYKF